MQPTARVLDLFAVPDDVRPVPGGHGYSVVAGDLVLSPGRDAATSAWLNPILAPLAVELDHERPRSLRIAMPIPTRDLTWVVDGWGATRFEPNARQCRDLDVLVATGRLLHARLASRVTSPPPGIESRTDRWARAAQVAFGESQPTGIPNALVPMALRIMTALDDTAFGPDQLVHGNLAGNVLLDADGVPLVIDVSAYWRPVLWAEAVTVLSAVVSLGADAAALREWARGERRQAMLRAALFLLLSDERSLVDDYERVLIPALRSGSRGRTGSR